MPLTAAPVDTKNSWTQSWATPLALIATLALYPLFRMVVSYADLFPASGSEAQWWSLWGVIFIGHWICAAIVLAAIASEGATLKSIGLNVSIFVKRRWLFLLLIFAAAIIAYYAPQYFYGDQLPEKMRSHPLGPVTSAQRIFWIAMAITAGFVEEFVYRGYALTRLRKFFGLPLAILFSLISFTLMHGPSALMPEFAALYIVAGLIFTGLFIFMKSRRLEALIILHFGLDLALIAAP